MNGLRSLANAFIAFIRVGAITRIAFCFLKMIGNEEEINVYKKRIKNVIIFYIVAEGVWRLKNIITYYFT